MLCSFLEHTQYTLLLIIPGISLFVRFHWPEKSNPYNRYRSLLRYRLEFPHQRGIAVCISLFMCVVTHTDTFVKHWKGFFIFSFIRRLHVTNKGAVFADFTGSTRPTGSKAGLNPYQRRKSETGVAWGAIASFLPYSEKIWKMKKDMLYCNVRCAFSALVRAKSYGI